MNETSYKMILERKTERGDPVITPCYLSEKQYQEIVRGYVEVNAGKPRAEFAAVVEKRVRELDRKREQDSRKKKVKRK